jgi:hypothetical protein
MRVEGAPPRSSGAHPRPTEFGSPRRHPPSEYRGPADHEYTRERQQHDARSDDSLAGGERGSDAVRLGEAALVGQSDSLFSHAPDEGDSDYDGYHHTEHEPIRPEVRGEVGPLIEALHEIFERDRGVASQGASARCGICYLHFPLAELMYRDDEGFYVCSSCTKALGHTQVFMVRKQQK